MKKLKHKNTVPPPSGLKAKEYKVNTSSYSEHLSEKENVVSVNVRQASTDENSNNVPRPRGQYLLKQLSSSLSPKMTEISTDADRRVSRYGRHQKQKDNSDYVPVDLMRYVAISPLKSKQKAEAAEQENPEFPKLEQPLPRTPPADEDVSGRSETPHEDKKILNMDEIKIVSADESNTDTSTSTHNFLHDLVVRKRSSDVDSAKGSSIDLGNGYRAGTIYWGAQSKKVIHWPCLVRVDPESERITRIHGDKMMEIHVSFFADKGRRGWIKETCMVPFEGVENYCTEARNLHYGKYVKQALRTNLLKRWKVACDLAEKYFAMPIDDRIAKYDEEVKAELITLKIERHRSAIRAGKITQQALSHHVPETVPFNHRTVSDSQTASYKRERSSSPESPAYEALPGLGSSKNPMKRVKCSTPSKTTSSQYDSRFDRFLQSLDSEEMNTGEPNAGLMETASPTSEMNHEYDDILQFIRYYMFDGRTNHEIEESLQFHVRRICCLKNVSSNRGSDRTASRQRALALRNTFEKMGLKPLASDSKAEMANNPKPRHLSQSIKKEPQSLEDKFIFQLDKNVLTKGIPKGFVCYVCNRPNNVTKCSKCLQHVHLLCLTDDAAQVAKLQEEIEEKRFSCAICSTTVMNEKKCFICNDGSEETIAEEKFRCTESKCTREYHLSCLRLFPQYRVISTNTIVCPYHVCHTCVSNDPRNTASLGKAALTSCMKCPASYHPDARCIPAGSEILTSKQLVCPKHSVEQIALNVNWCFICGKGGELICCEACPFACHLDCLPFSPPVGKYFCEQCESGRMPLYNEIVIAKMGIYRWWPALTVPPSEIPERVLQKPHKPSDICVKFFNTYDMCWLNRKRMYLYQHEDSENLGEGKSGSSMDKKYRLAMIEASKIFQILESTKQPRPYGSLSSSKAAPIYTKIKSNRYVAPLKQPSTNRRQLDGIEDSVCRCQPGDEDPCGPTSACLNRAIFMECSAKTCPAKDRCSNQRFTKRMYPALEVRNFADKGFGLVTLEDLQSGQFVIEYVGEVINSEEFDRRVKTMQTAKEENYYFLTVEPDLTIDAGSKGNMSRFINHSCEPNCETQKWTIGETRVIGLFAITDIKAGKELTFNYNLESLGNSKRACLCGAQKCSGFIGEKYRPTKKDDAAFVRNPGELVKGRKKIAKIRKTKKGTISNTSTEEYRTKTNADIQPAENNDVMLIPAPSSTIVDLVDGSVPAPPTTKPNATVVIKSEKVDDMF
uniref:Histone-lysine N-methyltransferase n=1 Tax=Anopheles stephensi TaxID=30069 RepID=A0A182YEQ0_ANOST